jgi:hypothetical protein
MTHPLIIAVTAAFVAVVGFIMVMNSTISDDYPPVAEVRVIHIIPKSVGEIPKKRFVSNPNRTDVQMLECCYTWEIRYLLGWNNLYRDPRYSPANAPEDGL